MSSCALIVYGSLISKEELLLENIKLKDAYPIIVKNYRREFSQEPSYRFVDSQNRAVLRVDKRESHFFNAVLIPINKNDFKALDDREKGYNRVLVNKENIVYKYSSFQNDFDELYLYEGKAEKLNIEIFPNNSYLELCLKASKTWGIEFYNDFIKTTYVQGRSLEEFISNT